jgi:hypothetical protein
MKTNVTLKVEKRQLTDYANFAKSIKMNRSEMLHTNISEFIQQQNPQAS